MTSAVAPAIASCFSASGRKPSGTDGRMARELHGDRAHEDQRDRLGRPLAPGEERVDQGPAALLDVDAADVEEVRALEPVPAPESRGRRRPRPGRCPPPITADGRCSVWKRASTKARSSSTWKISARGSPEQAPEEVEVDRALVVGGRHQHRLVGDQRQPERRREIQVRVEEEPVVVVGMGADPLDQRGRERPLPPHPLGLVEERVRAWRRASPRSARTRARGAGGPRGSGARGPR